MSSSYFVISSGTHQAYFNFCMNSLECSGLLISSHVRCFLPEVFRIIDTTRSQKEKCVTVKHVISILHKDEHSKLKFNLRVLRNNLILKTISTQMRVLLYFYYVNFSLRREIVLHISLH